MPTLFAMQEKGDEFLKNMNADPYDQWSDSVSRDLYQLAYKTGMELNMDEMSLGDEVEASKDGPATRGRVTILKTNPNLNPETAWKENKWWTNLLVSVWWIHGETPAIGFLAIGNPMLKPAGAETTTA